MSTIKLNIGRKLMTITLLSFVGILITFLLFYQGLTVSLKQEKKIQSQILSDAGISIIKHFHSLVTDEGMNISAAQELAIKSLKSTKFGKNGYFWINNYQGVILMHPYFPELEGHVDLNSVDKLGNDLFLKFAKVAQDGGGFVEYDWPKPSSITPFPKISYVAHFKPWGWVLGTGLYLDDIEHEVQTYAFSALSVIFLFAIILVFLSISLTKKIVYQLENIAIRDPLTSLHTRRYLNENMENLMLRHKRYKDKCLSVIFFDIDYFKDVNDNYGHSCGDDVISSIAHVIRNTCRPDDLCIRYGGEEFVVILLSDNKDTSLHLAERICNKSHELVFKSNNTEFSVTLSAGIATCENNELFNSTLQRADENLYKAKKKGRNNIVN